MAILFMDGFEHYGTGGDGRVNMLDGVYAEAGTGPTSAFPSGAQARTGDRSLFLQATFGQTIRRAFPSAVGEVFVGCAFYAPTLPDNDDRVALCQLRDVSNNVLLSVVPLPTGAIAVRNGGLTSANVAVTSGPVIGAASWNYIEVRAVRSSGTVQVRVNGVQVLSSTAFSFGADFAQWSVSGRGAGGVNDYFWDDLIVNDTSGSYNTSWMGDIRVATLFPDEDGTPNGWARVGRDVFGPGVFLTQGGAAYVSHAGSLQVQNNDFTIEFWINFFDTPGSGRQTIAGHWNEAGDDRSWILYRDWSAGGNLKFDISTDGTVGTVTNIFNWSGWQPQLGRKDFVSISRVGTTLYLHINGRLQGAGFADANTYNTSNGPVWVGAEVSGNGPGVVSGAFSSFYMDEFRLTVGTGRYTSANYTPPSAAFPRDSGGDPDFNDVPILYGFNADPIVDEGFHNYNVNTTSTGIAEAQIVTEDTAGKYAVVDEATPFDRTFIAADFLFATGELTLTANPSDTETVTLGSTTYTFNTVLGGANSVLIGADADASLSNLAAAINGSAGAGSTYGTGTVANAEASAQALGASQLRATAASQGAAGNSVVSTETLANGAWTGATLAGGADIPAAQEFGLSPLPLDTTQVKGVQLYHRSRKTDASTCNIQTSFHVGASSDNGADRPITTAFTYWTDVFEEDPDTSAGLTPNSLVTGAFQINRTT